MFESIKETVAEIREDPPGKRFVNQYKRRQKERKGIINRILFIGGGVFITLAGIFLLPAPGPGTLVIFLGMGLIGQESLYIARLLDKLEVLLRKIFDWGKDKWDRASTFLKVLIVVITVILCLIAIYAAYVIFWN